MKEFLHDLASSKPTPGGGSASAMTGATGAALSAMLMGLSVDKAADADRARFEFVLKEATELQKELEALVEEDARSFDCVMKAFKLPKGTEEEKKARREAVQTAFKGAAQVPLEIMEKCFAVMKLGLEGIEKGNPNAVSDGGVSVYLAHAGLKGAALNVKINLGSIKDQEFVRDARNKVTDLLEEGEQLVVKAEALLEKKI